jgi:DNA segregation ATPase FtsK/SpoIIIE, S-DNA-T family
LSWAVRADIPDVHNRAAGGMADIRAPLGALGDGPETDDAVAPALPPMPKRVADDSLRALPPDEAIIELLARARRLADQLDEDVAELTADQQREKQRIEEEWRELEMAHKEAVGILAQMTAKARAIAEHKARVEEFERALATRVHLDESADFAVLARELELELRLARGITGAIRLPRIGSLLSQAALAIDHLAATSEQTRRRLLAATDDHLEAEGTEARASFEIGLMVLERDLEMLGQALPLSARPWDDEGWTSWTPPDEPAEWIRIGAHVHEALPTTPIPAVLSVGGDPGLLIEAGGHRAAAIAGLQSLLLRAVAAHPAGAVRFTLIDPNGLGESVAPLLALGEHDPALIDDGVRTLEAEIEGALAGLVRHIERITQNYLQGRFETLADFHLAAGEQVEPSRFLVVVDHPSGLTERAATLVHTIAETGPRAGVHTIVVKDTKPGARSRGGRQLPEMRAVHAKKDGLYVDTPSGQWRLELDTLPSPDRGGVIERVTREAGSRAREETRRPLDHSRLFATVDEVRRRGASAELPDTDVALDPSDRSTWWRSDAGDRVSVPIGRTAEREPVMISFDEHRPAALVAGGTDTDVGALLDAFVTGAAMLYSPAELQLLLVGLAGRRTFAPYADGGLPHARLVANDAEREVARSALETLDAELDRRIERFRAQGCERRGLRAYRQAAQRKTSRIVLVIDAVSELIAPGDGTAEHAGRLLHRLAAEGPPFGIHVLLAQDLRSTPTGSATALTPLLDHVGDRFLIQCEPRDVEALGTSTTVDDLRRLELERPGDAVLARVADASKVLRLVAVDQHDRASCVREVRDLADRSGVLARAQVIEGTAAANLEHAPFGLLAAAASATGDRRPPLLWLGDPLGIGPPVDVALRRQRGANLALVTDAPTGLGVLTGAVSAAVLSRSGHVEVHLVDLVEIDEGLADVLADLQGAVAELTITRPANLDRAVDSVERIVAFRAPTRDPGTPPVLFVINGLHQIDDPGILARLARLLRHGPEVGVHTVVWCESAPAFLQRLPQDARRDIGVRVVTSMDGAHGKVLVESEEAATLRPNHALLYDESRGRLTTIRPYQRPPAGWSPPLPARS